ncbi:MAG: hypothetical protein ACPG5B_01825 [Chitinophagales bacterium]
MNVTLKTKNLFKVLAILPMFLFFVSSCDKDTDVDPIIVENEIEDKVSFIINNQGNDVIDNKIVNITDFFEQQVNIGYDTDKQATILKVIGQWNGASSYVEFRLPIDSVGFATYTEADVFAFDYPADDKLFEVSVSSLIPYTFGAIRNVTVHIDEYGDVGERIKGRFYGQVFTYGSGTEEIAYINQGEFDVKRRY